MRRRGKTHGSLWGLQARFVLLEKYSRKRNYLGGWTLRRARWSSVRRSRQTQRAGQTQGRRRSASQMQHQKQNVRCARVNVPLQRRICHTRWSTRYLTRRNSRRAQDKNPRIPCRSHAHRRQFPTSTIYRTLQQQGKSETCT
ncbi:hypothetical protein PAXRUDRAFT_824805 [Paxillus rubicundulus Ve08.2h10]|uniref:Uncharacterized protein n=1 Tax=Paxillus rubicundulus Ve08.2h10 TaxID=930991 RepID=A0A0D0EBF9_9AGAM|nr:hypothetical protein PAXRUDRAFT_824805 [Paxillus rubicundulus Ve08.2h10]